jgi:hypothetical protein
MFHSLPAAVIAGELAFLLASGPLELRIYKAGAVVLGYVTHLVLDELYAVDLRRLRVKKSFGTALKMFSHKWWANGSTYIKLALLTLVVLKEPGWMNQVYQAKLKDPVERTAQQVQERLIR